MRLDVRSGLAGSRSSPSATGARIRGIGGSSSRRMVSGQRPGILLDPLAALPQVKCAPPRVVEQAVAPRGARSACSSHVGNETNVFRQHSFDLRTHFAAPRPRVRQPTGNRSPRTRALGKPGIIEAGRLLKVDGLLAGGDRQCLDEARRHLSRLRGRAASPPDACRNAARPATTCSCRLLDPLAEVAWQLLQRLGGADPHPEERHGRTVVPFAQVEIALHQQGEGIARIGLQHFIQSAAARSRDRPAPRRPAPGTATPGPTPCRTPSPRRKPNARLRNRRAATRSTPRPRRFLEPRSLHLHGAQL